jgi:hypothetical protein
MDGNTQVFPETYEESCRRFHSTIESIRKIWPAAQLNQRKLYQAPDLTLDWIEAEPISQKKQVFIFSMGEHGIEGYVGSALLDLFVREFLPGLNPQDTGLILFHAIDPWGMKNFRRVNVANVDLNRNFVWNGTDLNPSTNPEYASIDAFLNPKTPVTSKLAMQVKFLSGFLKAAARLGANKFRQATLLGQYRFEKGIYYGGSGLQEETSLVMGIFRDAVEQYERILLLDMHTGYGPRYEMQVVNSVQEQRDSKELERIFQYPHVVKTSPEEFYSIRGDMIEFIYTLLRYQAPEKHLYAASFEFGTFGDSFSAALRSLRTMIFENQFFWNGSKLPAHKTWIDREMRELYYPREEKWKASAMQNARAAFRGILRAEGFWNGEVNL